MFCHSCHDIFLLKRMGEGGVMFCHSCHDIFLLVRMGEGGVMFCHSCHDIFLLKRMGEGGVMFCHSCPDIFLLQVTIKILNVGAWARTSERVPVTLPRELEDFIPEVGIMDFSYFVIIPFSGGGVLQTETQRSQAAVAPPYVQWNGHFR